MSRVINLLLIIAILAGGFRLWRQQKMLVSLQAELRPLAAKFGALPVNDPSKYLITLVETGDPLHFLWRCYYPAGLGVNERCSFGMGGSSSGSRYHRDSGEYLQRCRFALDNGRLQVHMMGRGGGGLLGMNDPAMAAFLMTHWSELEIDVLAANGTVEKTTDETLPFLTIRIPEHLLSELPAESRERMSRTSPVKPLFEMVFGTQEAFEQRDAEELDAP